MQSAQHAAIGRVDVIVLDQLRGDACGRQDVFAISLGKKAAGIAALDRYNGNNTVDVEPFDLHINQAGPLFNSTISGCSIAQDSCSGANQSASRPATVI
jgi:hypothetical protein